MTPPLSPAAIIGTGIMGRGILQVLAQSGADVLAYDTNPTVAQAARDHALDMIAKLAAKGRLDPAIARSAPDRIRVIHDLRDLCGCTLVIEAVAEELAVKQALLAELEQIVAPECILASNTSSLMISAIAARCAHPGRVAGFHFFNPVPLMQVVEVIAGERTSEAVLKSLSEFAEAFGHTAVRTADTPGFLVNHAGRGLTTEGLRMVQERIATPSQIDHILTKAAGVRMGPFSLLDLTGLDVSSRVFDLIYDGFYHEPRFRPQPILHRRVAAGLYGRKSGEGFYTYTAQGQAQPVAEAAVPPGDGGAVWLGAIEAPWRDRLISLFPPQAIDGGAAPGAQSVIILAPIGHDTTTEASARNLDAARCVSIDPLFGHGPDPFLTVMPTVATDAAALFRVTGWLADTHALAVIADSPGFVCQRTVALIVNIACDLAQQGIASVHDIDAAVRLGLGYPTGPLTWGDSIGPSHILLILERMHQFYGDPRYRPSPWLKRRAMLGLSLRAEPSFDPLAQNPGRASGAGAK
ncbi:3-hydroxyacyl-CoA dehydrogenase [Aestuariivita sp.]|jgi:3-hydroxybutyryl-CoA dehydrogenase|uniref:3-hydroxyacyl-CoA dehydrogenase n=1 Tax=Aestuariivita sp. TaxID=1872407 RepID=UPI0025B87B0C|nr:3-hydroxyacyl-CoA dehydrogenase [Aestuariivita sp.]